MFKYKYLFLLTLLSSHISKSSESLKIIGLTTASAITYGILSDQLVARMSSRTFECFTNNVGRVFIEQNINNPTKIGFAFGVMGTWHIGLILGGALATFSRVGSLPKLSAQDLWLVTPAAFLLLGFCSFKDEISRSSQGKKYINNPDVPENDRIRAGKDIIESGYSYGVLIGLCLCGYTMYMRTI